MRLYRNQSIDFLHKSTADWFLYDQNFSLSGLRNIASLSLTNLQCINLFHRVEVITRWWFFTANFHYVKCVQIRSFFWSLFSHSRTKYREIRSISPYSFRMRENTDQQKLRIWTIFHTVFFFKLQIILKRTFYQTSNWDKFFRF